LNGVNQFLKENCRHFVNTTLTLSNTFVCETALMHTQPV